MLCLIPLELNFKHFLTLSVTVDGNVRQPWSNDKYLHDIDTTMRVMAK